MARGHWRKWRFTAYISTFPGCFPSDGTRETIQAATMPALVKALARMYKINPHWDTCEVYGYDLEIVARFTRRAFCD